MATRIAAIAIVLVSLALAGVWAVRVPFFQEPDELAHFDYAAALFDAGRPFVAHDAVSAKVVMPEARALAAAARYRTMRYDPDARFPEYGGRAWFAATDLSAPLPAGHVPGAGAPLPYVAFAYPEGYYAVAAVAMRFAYLITSGSLTAAYLGARAVGIVCLGITLASAWVLFRTSGLRAPLALAALAAIGLFPLTSWVAGSVQPDVLTAALLTTMLALTSCLQRTPGRAALVVGACATIVALDLVKQHYAAATLAASVLALLATAAGSRGRRSLAALRAAGFIAVAGVSGLALSFFATPAGRLGGAVAFIAGSPGAPSPPLLERAVAFETGIVQAANDLFFGSNGHASYWFEFGYRGERLFPHAIEQVLAIPVILVTGALLIAFLAAEVFLAARLLRVAKRRSWRLAFRHAAGFAPLTCYAAFTAIMLAANARTGGQLWLEGRYWLPPLAATYAIALVIVPKVTRGRTRRIVARSIAFAGAGYALVAAPLALTAIDRWFVSPPSRPLPYALIATVEPSPNGIGGYAVDMSTGEPARTVRCTLDSRALATRTGEPARVLAQAYNDDVLRSAGFSAPIDRTKLAPGAHVVRCAVVQADGRIMPFETALTV